MKNLLKSLLEKVGLSSNVGAPEPSPEVAAIFAPKPVLPVKIIAHAAMSNDFRPNTRSWPTAAGNC